MATLEDKILGEKPHNYCSSSEDSGSDGESDGESGVPKQPTEPPPELPTPNKWEGSSTNTGPKGVLKDWQRFKQLETEKRSEDARERIELMKKLTLTVQSALDEEKEKQQQQEAEDDPDLAELLSDDAFLLNYQKQRMQELMAQQHGRKFGAVVHLGTAQDFLDAVDNEHKAVKVVVHLYENRMEACRTMNACLEHLAKLYDAVKFCAIVASQTGLSSVFKAKGVPALLVYRNGHVIGNFVRLSDDLGTDFCAEDLQAYLVEHGMLEDKTCTPLIIKGRGGDEDLDSD